MEYDEIYDKASPSYRFLSCNFMNIILSNQMNGFKVSNRKSLMASNWPYAHLSINH
jgi:hypothetical protein